MASLAPSTSAQIADPAAGPYNLAVQAQYVGLLALLEDKVVHCFRNGGGVPYDGSRTATASSWW